MCLILNIETATTVCSVSVSDKQNVITCEEVNGGYTHAEDLHVFIKEMLAQAGVQISSLSAVAVSRGPGSYTGLRIGVSAAKGIAYALGIPLISVDTLAVMARAALNVNKCDAYYVPMLDARRMEVYCAMFNGQLETVVPVSAHIVAENSLHVFEKEKPVIFFGDGMPKCRNILAGLKDARFIENIVPSSEVMPFFSYQSFLEKKFEDVAYFEPYYLKEFLITTKKNTVK